MKGLCGYGRYEDDPAYVGCPRARTDMTPCVARDGRTAVDDGGECVGCAAVPFDLLSELQKAMDRPVGRGGLGRRGGASGQDNHADKLRDLVRIATEPLLVGDVDV